MKVKVTYGQIEAMYALFTELMHLPSKGVFFGNKEARLCYLLLHSIYEKLHRLILPVGSKVKPKYTLNLSETECLSMFLFFQMYDVPQHHFYAGATIQAISQYIDQQFI